MLETRELEIEKKPAQPSRNEVWKLFDRIAHRYDLLNRLLSFGQDIIWRKKVAKYLPSTDNQRILDLATGTADLLISNCLKNEKVRSAIGIDMAQKMLHIGREKITQRGLKDKAQLIPADATNLPFNDQSFSAVTISFGIRNVIDVSGGLAEMKRVLQNNGRAIILEFSLPSNVLFRKIYLFYFRNVLPRIGGIISGDSYAYSYLNQTVETFPYGNAFCELMRKAGFGNVAFHPLTFGIATIYTGERLL